MKFKMKQDRLLGPTARALFESREHATRSRHSRTDYEFIRATYVRRWEIYRTRIITMRHVSLIMSTVTLREASAVLDPFGTAFRPAKQRSVSLPSVMMPFRRRAEITCKIPFGVRSLRRAASVSSRVESHERNVLTFAKIPVEDRIRSIRIFAT